MGHLGAPRDIDELEQVKRWVRGDMHKGNDYIAAEIALYESYRRGEDPEWAELLANDEPATLLAIDVHLVSYTIMRADNDRTLAAIEREPEDDDPGYEEVLAAMVYLAGDNPGRELLFMVSPEARWSLAREDRFTLDTLRPGELNLRRGKATWVLAGKPEVRDIDWLRFDASSVDAPYLRQDLLGGEDAYILPPGFSADARGLYTGLRQHRTRAEATVAMADVLAQQSAGLAVPASEDPAVSRRARKATRGQGR